MSKLAENLKSYRKLSALTQQNLAKKLNITQQAYANYENDVSEPNLQVLIELSAYYNVSLDTLVGLTNNEHKVQIAPNLAKDIWLNSLTELQRETVERVTKLNELDLYKTNFYILGLLEKN